ncbi:hypothetical protein C8R48DRAFT_672643 [Suillus tomentosus]|nr:hypothetical protein C8R48DRAFT_672643 [Suillus tomentosus]
MKHRLMDQKWIYTSDQIRYGPDEMRGYMGNDIRAMGQRMWMCRGAGIRMGGGLETWIGHLKVQNTGYDKAAVYESDLHDHEPYPLGPQHISSYEICLPKVIQTALHVEFLPTQQQACQRPIQAVAWSQPKHCLPDPNIDIGFDVPATQVHGYNLSLNPRHASVDDENLDEDEEHSEESQLFPGSGLF